MHSAPKRVKIAKRELESEYSMSVSEPDCYEYKSISDIQNEISSKKIELDRNGRWLGPKLELIRPHIKPLIKKGISIPVLRGILNEAGIKSSDRHLRKHLSRMFPYEYERLYLRKSRYSAKATVSNPEPHEENEKFKSSKMDVEELLKNVRDYRGTGV